MDRRGYHQQAVDMLGWIFGWYKLKDGHYVVPNGFQVHHIDGNYTNNSLDNLVILTVEEHMKMHEKERNERCKIGGKMTGAINGKKSSKPVICVETGVVYESLAEAGRQTGISYKNISAVCRGKQYNKTAGGFHWEYVDDEG